jgi:hypothetical protein
LDVCEHRYVGIYGTNQLIVDYFHYYAPTNVLFWAGTNSAYWTNSANWVAGMSPLPTSDLTFSYLMAAPGSYTLTYTANDGNGNIATATRTVNVVDTPAPLSITELGGSQLQLDWESGTLQGATNATGPYSAIPGAAAPYTVPAPTAQQYYRLR